MDQSSKQFYKRCLVGIAGETAAGKSSVRDFLLEQTHACAVATRDPLFEYATQKKLPTDRAGLQQAWRKLADIYGDNVIWQLLSERLYQQKQPVVIVEGLRRAVDLVELRTMAETLERELVLVYLHADKELRFMRFNKRQKDNGEPPISLEDFERLEADETASQLITVRTDVENHPGGIVIDTSIMPIKQVGERVLWALPIGSLYGTR